MPPPNRFLLAGAALSALAAMAHLGCIVFGAAWYRALGAGERMARMAEAGHPSPTLITLAITAMLALWAAYALSGAGVIRRLPLRRTVLCAITAVYLLRGLAFMVIVPWFPGNSTTFWIVSSAICLGIGAVHLIGVRQAWRRM